MLTAQLEDEVVDAPLAELYEANFYAWHTRQLLLQEEEIDVHAVRVLEAGIAAVAREMYRRRQKEAA